jgi:putative transposase
MLSYEYKLQVTPAQQAAIDEAIRVAQFIRNKCLRLWMDGQGITANDLQIACSRLAHEFAFVARLNSQARQAAADRAWAAIGRFYANCTAQRPGKKGYPRFRHDCRSVEYKDTGWRLDPDGKHLTFTDGCGIGRVKLIGTRDLATFSSDQFKRVRLIRRADGYYAQVVIAAARRVTHVPTGKVVGIDVGLNVYYTDSTGHAVDNPRFIQAAERRLRRRSRRLSRKSVQHKQGKKAKHNHAARQRAKHNKYPSTTASALPSAVSQLSAAPPATRLRGKRQSANWHKARQQLGRAHLTLQRQREDFARKQASALVSSHDLIALEDLQVRNLVRNRHLAKSISDASWARFRQWVEYYGQVQGIPVVAVPPHYTSEACSRCGRRVHKSLSVRTHVCPRCGLVLDRDHNAARNILARALEQRARSGTVGHTGT